MSTQNVIATIILFMILGIATEIPNTVNAQTLEQQLQLARERIESVQANSSQQTLGQQLQLASERIEAVQTVENLLNAEQGGLHPVGIAAVGIVNNGSDASAYQIKTHEIVAYVHVNSIDTNPPNPGASLQLNVILHVVKTTGAINYWLQNVIQFEDTQQKEARILDNIWSAHGQHDSLVHCVKLGPSFLNDTQCQKLSFYYKATPEFNYQLPLSTTLMINEQPVQGQGVQVRFIYTGHGLKHIYDQIMIKIPNIKSASLVVTPYALTGSGQHYDAEWVWGGEGGGRSAYFTSMDSQLGLFYANKNNIGQPFPYYFPYGLDTAETAQNIQITSQEGGESFVGLVNSGS
jgi:hypothetical protein